MDIKLVEIDKVKPYDRNPRKNAAVDKVADSLKDFGFRQPIVVDAEMVIIAGHTRFAAAQKLGLKQVPIHVAKDLTQEQVKAYRIADNRSAEDAEGDEELLGLEIKDLELAGYDLKILGFDDDELASIIKAALYVSAEAEGDPDEVIDPPEEAISQLGDLYEIGEHRLLCGDSTAGDNFEILMQDKKADLIFTDPPYGVSYADKNEALNAANKGNRVQREIINDHLTAEQTYELWTRVFSNLFTSAKKGAAYYVCSPQGGGLLSNMCLALKNTGWLLKHCIIWVKNQFVLGRCDYHYQHEPIFYGWKDGAAHTWLGGRNQSTVWEINKPQKSENHPTMKPVALVEKALKNSSNPGDLVLEPFGGSGSTMVAAQQVGRICYAMELDPIYCDLIVNRMRKLFPDLVIKRNGQPI